MTWSSLALAVRMRRRTPGLVATVIRRGSPLMSSLDAIAYQYTRTTHLHNPLPEKDDPIMKSRLIAAVSAMLLLLTVGAAGATAAPTTRIDRPGDTMTPDAGWTTAAHNLSGSDRNVQVARYRDGGGTRYSLRPGQSTSVDIDSVWVGHTYPITGCRTYINGTLYPYQGWVNTAWWRKIHVDVDC